MLKTINTSVFLAALNMSLPEARSFTLHHPGPQEPDFMLIRLVPFRGPSPSCKQAKRYGSASLGPFPKISGYGLEQNYYDS